MQPTTLWLSTSSTWGGVVARSRFNGKMIRPPDGPGLTFKNMDVDEQSFVDAKIVSGLSDREVVRMFFRRYGRDITSSSIHRRRQVGVLNG